MGVIGRLMSKFVLAFKIIRYYDDGIGVLAWYLFSQKKGATLHLKNGINFYVAAKEHFGILNEVYVRDCYGWLFDRIEPDSMIIDVGANIGSFTVLAAKMAGKVISVEPEEHNIAALKRNIKANNMKNIVVEGVAASDRKAHSYLYTHGMSSHSIVSKHGARERIATDTIKNMMARNHVAHVTCLKIDCEGAEFMVLKGTPLEAVDNIMMEVHENIYHNAKGDPGLADIVNMLKKAHFTVKHDYPYLFASKDKKAFSRKK